MQGGEEGERTAAGGVHGNMFPTVCSARWVGQTARSCRAVHHPLLGLPLAGAAAQVGVSVEPLAELAEKEGSKLGAKEVRMSKPTRRAGRAGAGRVPCARHARRLLVQHA